jgi:GntR family transcriptional repressor for pyruvate dehydrogenase complex
LEVEIAAQAANCAAAEDLAQLQQIHERMTAAHSNAGAFAAADAEFHQALVAVLRNPMLSVLLDSIRTLMAEIRLKVSRYPEFDDIVLADHRAILDAITRQDAVGARAAMQDHLVHAREMQRALQDEHKPELVVDTA